MHDTEEASNIWIGGSVKNRILTLVKRTHPLIIGISHSTQENHKRVKHPKRSVWGFAYPCAPRPMIREGILTINAQTWVNSGDEVLN